MVKRELAFRLPYKIHPFIQDAVIEETVANGYVTNTQQFWLKHDVRALIPESVEGTWTEKQPGDYFYRMDPRSEWAWTDTDSARLLKPVLEQVEHLFTHMTRVKAFVQKPDMEIAPHRDLIAGNTYRHLKSATNASPGMYSGVYQGHPSLLIDDNTRHSDQKYLALKIPLSSDPSDGGRPFVFDGDNKVYLQAHDHLYFLNEYAFHGCESVGFYRGVVFVDGIVNPEALEAEEKLNF